MKISNFKGNASNLKVFKPIQYLNITGNGLNINNIKLRVRLVNSDSGRVDEIIPSMGLGVLGEICSMNEGFYISLHQTEMSHFNVNVMLHPTSSIYLSNDKYLEIDVLGNNAADEISIYGLESAVIDRDFVCRYNKFYMSAGELQKTFMIGENENLVIPRSSFEEVTLQYKVGTSCTYTEHELGALMMLKNDVVCLPSCFVDTSLLNQGSCACFGYLDMYGLDVSDVECVTIKRTAATSAFELVMIDTIKD